MALDLTDMQRGLALAVEMAKSGSDDISHLVRDEGRRVVFILNGLVRLAGIHESGNEAFTKPSVELSSLLKKLLGLLGAVHIIFVDSQVYVNDIRLRVNAQEQAIIDAFTKDLIRHKIGGISIHREVSPTGLKALGLAISREAAAESPRKAVLEDLPDDGAIELSGSYHFHVGGEKSAQQKDYLTAISRGASSLHQAVGELADGHLPNPLPLRRAVIDMVEGLVSDPETGLNASFSAGRKSVGEGHLLRTTNLALLLGAKAGLSEGELSNLGVCTMMHDVGYTLRGGKTGHGAAGLRVLAKQRGFHESKVRRLLAVYQHHWPHNGPRKPSLFARILHIVDDYDVLTASRPGQPPPRSPSLVLEGMWNKRGKEYDPDLLTLFVQMMGKYPPGTLLELDDGSWGVSCVGGRDQAHFAWPMVRLVRNGAGHPLTGLAPLDLYDWRLTMDHPTVLDPSETNIDCAETLERVALESKKDDAE